MRAPATGSAGESNGTFSISKRLSDSPGMSTPSQKERTPNRQAGIWLRISSISCAVGPSYCANRGIPNDCKGGRAWSRTLSKRARAVNKAMDRPPVRVNRRGISSASACSNRFNRDPRGAGK